MKTELQKAAEEFYEGWKYGDWRHKHGQKCPECGNEELDVYYNGPGGSNHYWGLGCGPCGKYWNYGTYDHRMYETTEGRMLELVLRKDKS